MIEFHQTGYGKRFFESQLPDLIDNLRKIAKGMQVKEVVPTIDVHSVVVSNNGIVQLSSYKNADDAFAELKRNAKQEGFVAAGDKHHSITEFYRAYREWQDNQKLDVLVHYFATVVS